MSDDTKALTFGEAIALYGFAEAVRLLGLAQQQQKARAK